jgi:hypothetical protein
LIATVPSPSQSPGQLAGTTVGTARSIEITRHAALAEELSAGRRRGWALPAAGPVRGEP